MKKRLPFILMLIMCAGTYLMRMIHIPSEMLVFERIIMQIISLIGAAGIVALILRLDLKHGKVLSTSVILLHLVIFVYYVSLHRHIRIYSSFVMVKQVLWGLTFIIAFIRMGKKWYLLAPGVISFIMALQSLLMVVSIPPILYIMTYSFWYNLLTASYAINLVALYVEDKKQQRFVA